MGAAAFSIGAAYMYGVKFFLWFSQVIAKLKGSMKARLESTGPDILKNW